MANSKTKKQQRQQTQNTASVAKATGLNLDATLSALSGAGVKIQGTISKIQEELITKFGELQAVDDAIKLKKQDMEALHGVDQTLLSLDDAKAVHQQELDRMSKEREELKKDFAALKTQLDTQRNREDEQYRYELNLRRKAENDDYTETTRVRNNEFRDREEKFNKDFQTRNEALTAKETEYNSALARFQTFDTEVKTQVDKQVAIVTNTMKRDFAHDKELSEVRHAAEVDRLTKSNNHLQARTEELAEANAQLATQLREALQAQTTLAKATVEAAANKQAQADALALVTNIGGGNGARPQRS